MMKYTVVSLKEKIMEMYPEIGEQNIPLGLVFDENKDCYIISLGRGNETLTTRLGKQDADECMKGIKCVYLGVQVAQFISNFRARQQFSQQAA